MSVTSFNIQLLINSYLHKVKTSANM